MKKNFIPLLVLFCSMMMAACAVSATAVPQAIASATPQAATEIKSLPTPVPSGQTVTYNEFQLTMKQAEITAGYLTDFGSTREPTVGSEFLWIHITFKNIGMAEQRLPTADHFSLLLDTVEFKPTYGHRLEHTDYTVLSDPLAAGEEVDAWLRFDIPAGTGLPELTFAFLPESTQVSFGFSSADYSWADHPIYLWTCAP